MPHRCAALLALGLALSGCDDHVLGEPLIDDTGTGSGSMYAADWDGVQAFFEVRCDACHGPGNDFDLRAVIENELASADPSTNFYVVPGDSDSSVLWRSIDQSGTAVPMPLGTPRLDEGEFEHIRAWIDAGAPL